jgi:hypothetical protein
MTPIPDGRGEGAVTDWLRILAYVTGTVDQELLARISAAENCILKAQLDGPLKLSNAERARLGEIGPHLDRKALAEIKSVAKPDTIWPGTATGSIRWFSVADLEAAEMA